MSNDHSVASLHQRRKSEKRNFLKKNKSTIEFPEPAIQIKTSKPSRDEISK